MNEDISNLYFVYCYYPNSCFKTKYIIGIYQTLEEAQSRQKSYMSVVTQISDDNVVYGYCKRNEEYAISFLRKYPNGEQFTEVS